MAENNNQALIDGLRMAADFLESKPKLLNLGPQKLRLWCRGNKNKLQEAARHLGSFTKQLTDSYFELHKPFNTAFEIEVVIERESVCTKRVIWDCPDDESLLKLVETGQSA